MFDVDPAAFGGLYESFLDRVHPDDRPVVLRANADARNRGRSFDLEYRVRDGKVWLSEAMTKRLRRRAVGENAPAGASPAEALTDREFEVFRLIGRGAKTAEIADRLHLSVKTVETYRDRIRQKLGLPDGTRLAHFATQWVLENDPTAEGPL